MLHGVEGAPIVVQANLHDIPDLEPPPNVHVLPPTVSVPEHPFHIPTGGDPVHHVHRPIPLYGIEVERVPLHPLQERRRELARLQRDDWPVVVSPVEVTSTAVEVRNHVQVISH